MDDKTFFMPGMLVTLKQDIPNKPTMLVIWKITSNSTDNSLIGILCKWFTSDGLLQADVWNTKDLQLVK